MSTALSPHELEAFVYPVTDERVTVVDADGWLYDAKSGEVLGREDVSERFVIDSPDKADWALELRSRLEGEIAGIDARLKALAAQLHAVRAEKIRRLSWWEFRFAPGLKEFARRTIEGTKSRTAQFAWGKVAFRKVSGRTEIIDMAGAVAYVRTWEPDLVKVVETVGVKGIKKALATAKDVTGEDESRSLPFIARSSETESVTISTGIDIERS